MKGLPLNVLLNFRLEFPKSDLTIYLPSGISEIFRLTGRVQRVIVNQQSSKTFNLNYGVPQGSCLGPVLFLLYASRLFEVVKKHLPSVHGYADDAQLYVYVRPDSFAAQDQAIENCIADVRAWLVSHRLMFNDSKTF